MRFNSLFQVKENPCLFDFFLCNQMKMKSL